MSTIQNTGATPAPYLGQAMNEFVPEFNYVAGVVSPVIMAPVDKKVGTLPAIKRAKQAGEDLSNRREPGSAYNRDKLAIGSTGYEVVGYGKEIPVAKEDLEWYGSIMQARVQAAGKIKNDLLVEREVKSKDMIFNTTTFTGTNLFTDYKAAPWSTAGSDAKGQILAAKEFVRKNTGMMGNALVVGHESYLNLINVNTYFSTTVLSGLAVATPQAIQAAVEAIIGLKIIDADAIYNSAIEGQDFDGDYIWPDTYAMIARINTTSNPAESGLSRIVGWSPEPSAMDMEFSTYEEPQTKSTVVQGDMYYDQLVRDPAFGHLIQIETA